MTRLQGDAAAEWRMHWPVVLAASAGVAVSTINSYSTSLFIEPFQHEFGWSRAQISSAHVVAAVAAVVLGPVIGLFVDRIGPRRIGIAAVLAICGATALLSLTGPSIWSWRGLWVIVAAAVVLVQPTVWTSAVTGLFARGRGLALAVTLCGSSIGSLVTPPLTYFLIEQFGWRLAFVALAGCWLVVVLPLVVLFFRGRHDGPAGKVTAPAVKVPVWPVVRATILTRRFVQLVVAGFSIAVVAVSTAVTIVPILSSMNIARGQAAGIASLLGLASITGRLSIGFLLDRIEGRVVAALCVCLPIVGCALLIGAPGSIPAAIAAVLFFGLALGAELDILAYLTSRYFSIASFGLLFGTIGGFITLAGGTGPVALNAVYDATHSYTPALWAMIPLCLVSALLFLLLGPYPDAES